jgi:predicted nucleic acid-binding protein
MSSRIVVDTSVIVKWLNQTNEVDLDKADQIMELALKGEIELFAPELAKYETNNVLLRGKQLTHIEAQLPLATLYSLPITFIPESLELAKLTYSLADELVITYYDASFLSIANEFDATLVTENIKHQGKTDKISVSSLKDY